MFLKNINKKLTQNHQRILLSVMLMVVIIGLTPLIMALKRAQFSNAGANLSLSQTEGPTSGGNVVTIQSKDDVFRQTINIKKFDVSLGFACGIDDQNDTYCWGGCSSNHHESCLGIGKNHELNYGHKARKVNQRQLPSNAYFVDIAVGGGIHACGLTNHGEIYCWGDSFHGETGAGNPVYNPIINDVYEPTKIMAGEIPTGVKFTQVVAGGTHSCAIADNQQVYCWGNNNYGVLGAGRNFDIVSNSTSLPVQVVRGGLASDEHFTQLSLSQSSSCGLTNKHKVYCWGVRGVIGDGQNHTLGANQPTAIKLDLVPSDRLIVQVAAGSNHACALDSFGQAYCWGKNDKGQLGNAVIESAYVPTYIPVLVRQDGGLRFKQLTASGNDHNCGLSVDNRVYCWGNGSNYQIGTEAGGNSSTPRQVALPAGIQPRELRSSKMANSPSCLGDQDGKLYCWGSLSGMTGQKQSNGDWYIQSAKPLEVKVFPTIRVDVDNKLAVSEFVDGRRLRVTMPAHEPGLVDVTVVLPSQRVLTLASAYRYVSSNNQVGDSTDFTKAGGNANLVRRSHQVASKLPNSGFKKVADRSLVRWLVVGVAGVAIIGATYKIAKNFKLFK